MASYVYVDTSAAPLCLRVVRGAPQSPEQLHADLLDDLERQLLRREPFADAYDVTLAYTPLRDVR